jgi:hypothetical protein
MDRFFTQKHCDRCGGSLENGRTMSMFNEDCICRACRDTETKKDSYAEAVQADHEEIKNGNYNFGGIGYE